MKNVFFLYLIAVILLACDQSSNNSSDSSKTISVSAGVESYASPLNATNSIQRSFQIEPMNDEEYYREDRKAANRGSLRHQLTPKSFVMQISNLVLYNEIEENVFNLSFLLEPIRAPDNLEISMHFDLAYADDFIRNVEINEPVYHGLSMMFSPNAGLGWSEQFYSISVTGINLPDEYDGITLPGSEYLYGTTGLPPDLTYFTFDILQPFKPCVATDDGQIGFLSIGSNISQDGIQNPEGAWGVMITPIFQVTGRISALYFSTSEDIDFTPYENPEIVLAWDLNNLVEIWDNGTENDLTDDIVTYSVTNPFPFSIRIQENTAHFSDTEEDKIPPSDVIVAAISNMKRYNILQWINPQDEDFNEVVIIRKEWSAPEYLTDGEEVYRGYIPVYYDIDGILGVHYYYLIKTVDHAGNYSDGVLLDRVQTSACEFFVHDDCSPPCLWDSEKAICFEP